MCSSAVCSFAKRLAGGDGQHAGRPSWSTDWHGNILSEQLCRQLEWQLHVNGAYIVVKTTYRSLQSVLTFLTQHQTNKQYALVKQKWPRHMQVIGFQPMAMCSCSSCCNVTAATASWIALALQHQAKLHSQGAWQSPRPCQLLALSGVWPWPLDGMRLRSHCPGSTV